VEKFKNGKIRISVRNLVEFVLRQGDIDNRRSGMSDKSAMKEGARIHKKIQNRMGSTYNAEVPLSIDISYDKFSVNISGRADGIIIPVGDEEYDFMVDEIKSMYADVDKIKEPSTLHLYQAYVYAYIYGIKNDLEKVAIQITYVNIDTENIKYFNYIYSLKTITEMFYDLMGRYYRWADYIYSHTIERNTSAKELEFPFAYRKGQREIAVSVYKSILKEKSLYIQAPTGVGKTLSVIFPTVKSVGEGITDKIFYLTAKSVTGVVALNAFNILRKKGLLFKVTQLTAKDKICIKEKTECNPDYCERAKGHLSRVNDCIYDIISNEDEINRNTIQKYAKKHNVCPFELSLDVSNYCDLIVCDYNYAFDPVAKLKRYFADGSKEDYVFLVDEAHNLVDRAREMYSSIISKDQLLEVKKIMEGRDKRITGAIAKCERLMLARKRELLYDEYAVLDNINELILDLSKLFTYFEKFFEKTDDFEDKKIVLDLYFTLGQFLNIYDRIDENYEIISYIDEYKDYKIKLFCINPSTNLSECFGSTIGRVFFSATLLPVNYYKMLITGDLNDYAVYIDSPFENYNREIMISSDISTKFTKRSRDLYKKIAFYIYKTILCKKGNYMAFFPSYKFLLDVYEEFMEILEIENKVENIEVLMQSSNMNDEERDEFLNSFEKNEDRVDEYMVAFCVMGGIFSEGIDLTHELLIGTIVVGTGFPQVGMEREIIKNYFDRLNHNGFDYSYRFPGINKVLQSCGRVIRTKDDKGVILLLDERFLENGYKNLFPREWHDLKKVNSDCFENTVNEFWHKFNE